MVLSSTTQSGYSIGPGTGGTLLFSNGSGTATLAVTAGTHSISAPMSFTGNGVISLAANAQYPAQLTVSANVSGSPSVANNGALIFNGGAQTVGPITGNGSLDVTGGATTTAASVQQASIEIDAGAKLALTAAEGATKSSANALMIAGTTNAWTGDFDVGASGIVLSNATSAEAAISANQLDEGSADHWAGTGGITSSYAHANPGEVSVGSYYNSASKTLKIAAALPGDALLTGQVTAADINIVLENLGGKITPGLNWQSGDFAYVGQVTASDLNIVLENLGANLPAAVQSDADVAVPRASAAGGPAAVPEPGTLALLVAGLALAGIVAVGRRPNRAG